MNTVFLSGKKTNLRPLRATDEAHFVTWMNNPETRTYLLRRFPLTELDERKWIEKTSQSSAAPSDIVLVIETKRGSRPIGIIGLHAVSWVDRHGTTGTIIGEKSFRGKGYGTDAKMTLLRYAFETLGMHKIISHADTKNKASIAYSKRCGYIQEGVLKEHLFRDGVWGDTVTLACFYPAFKKASKK